MKLEFAFLADAANVLPNGGFDLIGGGFNILRGRTFPATKYAMALVGRLLFEPAEHGGKYILDGEIVDENGNAIFPPMHTEPFEPPKNDGGGPSWITVCMNCQGVTFPKAGLYRFRLSIGGRLLGELTIDAVPEEQPT